MSIRKGTAILLAALLLVGCSKNQEPTRTVCQGPNGIVDETIFISEGDKVIKQIEHDMYSFSDLGMSVENAQDQAFMDNLLATYESLFSGIITKGLTFSYEIDEDNVIFTIELDYTVADMKELVQWGVISEEETEFISLAETIKNFESEEGIKCQ